MVAHEVGSRNMQTLAGISGAIEYPMLSDSSIFKARDLGAVVSFPLLRAGRNRDAKLDASERQH